MDGDTNWGDIRTEERTRSFRHSLIGIREATCHPFPWQHATWRWFLRSPVHAFPWRPKIVLSDWPKPIREWASCDCNRCCQGRSTHRDEKSIDEMEERSWQEWSWCMTKSLFACSSVERRWWKDWFWRFWLGFELWFRFEYFEWWCTL